MTNTNTQTDLPDLAGMAKLIKATQKLYCEYFAQSFERVRGMRDFTEVDEQIDAATEAGLTQRQQMAVLALARRHAWELNEARVQCIGGADADALDKRHLEERAILGLRGPWMP